jgi:hypothetical protein
MTTTEPVRSSNAELAAMTLPQLKEVASQLGIDGAAKLKKDLLVTAISDLQAANREAAKAEREARRIAEQEAFEQAVAEQVAALKKRPLEERMLAEVEELRHVVSTLSSQLSSTLKTPPPSYGLDNLQSKVASLSASPWNSGIEQVKAQLAQISSQISAQNSQLADIRSLATKPARSLTVVASVNTLMPMNNRNDVGHPCVAVERSPSGTRTLLVIYHLIHQSSVSASGPQNFLEIQENQTGTIAVPVGQKMYIASAAWKPHNNVRGGQTLMDVTAHLKAMGIENQ